MPRNSRKLRKSRKIRKNIQSGGDGDIIEILKKSKPEKMVQLVATNLGRLPTFKLLLANKEQISGNDVFMFLSNFMVAIGADKIKMDLLAPTVLKYIPYKSNIKSMFSLDSQSEDKALYVIFMISLLKTHPHLLPLFKISSKDFAHLLEEITQSKRLEMLGGGKKWLMFKLYFLAISSSVVIGFLWWWYLVATQNSISKIYQTNIPAAIEIAQKINLCNNVDEMPMNIKILLQLTSGLQTETQSNTFKKLLGTYACITEKTTAFSAAYIDLEPSLSEIKVPNEIMEQYENGIVHIEKTLLAELKKNPEDFKHYIHTITNANDNTIKDALVLYKPTKKAEEAGIMAEMPLGEVAPTWYDTLQYVAATIEDTIGFETFRTIDPLNAAVHAIQRTIRNKITDLEIKQIQARTWISQLMDDIKLVVGQSISASYWGMRLISLTTAWIVWMFWFFKVMFMPPDQTMGFAEIENSPDIRSPRRITRRYGSPAIDSLQSLPSPSMRSLE